MDTPPSEPVTCSDIAELTAWARRLSTAGARNADPAELAAFLAAKTDLLSRIRIQNPQTTEDRK